MTLRRRLLWLRARVWRLARGHYMLAATATVLVLAAVGGAGGFDDASVPRAAKRPAAVAPVELSDIVIDPRNQPPPGLVVTYYLVDSEFDRNALNLSYEQVEVRDWRWIGLIEVLLARDATEEAAAREAIEEGRRFHIGAAIRVEDLRGR